MFKGLTFDNQNVTSKNDGGLYDRIFSKDGILRGCSMSVNNTALTVQPGLLVIGGRLVWVDSATSVGFDNPVTNGYGRVILTIDLSQPASMDEFAQIQTSVDYSATTAFTSLKQENINGEGGALIYQAALAVVSIANGNLAAVVSTIGNTQIDADLLGGQPRGYYSVKSATDTEITNLKNKITPSARGSANDANTISEDGWWLCSKNIPAGIGGYAYVLQVTYTSNSRMQIACPYNPTGGASVAARTSAPLYFRLMYPYSDATAWNVWQPIDAGSVSSRGSANNANSLPWDGWWLCNAGVPSGYSYSYVLQITHIASAKMQIACPYNPIGGLAGGARTSAPLYYRLMYPYSDGSGWSPWQPITIGGPNTRGSENNANSLPWDGWWLCRTNIPSGIGNYAYVLQQSYIASTHQMQIALPYGTSDMTMPMFYRTKYPTVNSGNWTPWNTLVNTSTFKTQLTNNIQSVLSTTVISKMCFSLNAYLWGYSDGTFGWRAKSLNILQLNGSSAGTPITAGTYTTVSTRKTKTAIEDLDLERAKKLLDIRPVEFEIRDDTGHKKHYGMIAEEVEDVDDVPVTHDDTGEIIGLDYQGFIAPLIRLAQEQERRINELEKKIDELSQKKE